MKKVKIVNGIILNESEIRTMKSRKKPKTEIDKMSRAQKLDYYSHLNDLISVNNGNAKTGIGCLTMSMPVITCRADAPCKEKHTCYCMRGHQAFAGVCGAYYRNFRLWNEDQIRFEEQLDSVLFFSNATLFRYNDAGEIPDKSFLAMMFRVAEKHPKCKFLAYTKKYELINDFVTEGNELPKNLTIRFSMWDKNWEVPNPYGLPVAYVDFKDKEKNPVIPQNSFVCPGKGKATCSSCKVCFNKSVKSVAFKQH